MKLLFVLISITITFFTGENIFNYGYTTLKGSDLAISQFSGKKLIIATFNGAAPDTNRLLILDSLQQENKDSIAVIAIPAKDFADSIDTDALKSLCDSIALGFSVTQPMYVKR